MSGYSQDIAWFPLERRHVPLSNGYIDFQVFFSPYSIYYKCEHVAGIRGAHQIANVFSACYLFAVTGSDNVTPLQYAGRRPILYHRMDQGPSFYAQLLGLPGLQRVVIHANERLCLGPYAYSPYQQPLTAGRPLNVGEVIFFKLIHQFCLSPGEAPDVQPVIDKR